LEPIPAGAVFISYASQDASTAARIAGALRAAGIEVWFDQSELRGGDAWDQSIRKQIKTCALFLPVISRNTRIRDEGYFRLEWKLAVDRSHMMAADKAFLLPVVIDDTPDDDERVPERFREVQWARAGRGEVPAAFAGRVKRLLARESEAPLPSSPAAPEHSIAVLPFVNISDDPKQEYFADGLAEEMLNLLSRIPELRVAARTSAFSFKGKSDDITTIARKLLVAHVLEGSVRKSGNNLRITVQLVKADNGYRLWSQTFDRILDDIFKIQDEIAAAIVGALKISLLAQNAPKATATPNLDAYTQYLQARERCKRASRGDQERVVAQLQNALRLDPKFAPAWALLATVRTFQLELHLIPRLQAQEEARQAAQTAIALDPDHCDAHVSMARVHFFFDWDWPAAELELRKARQINSNDSNALRWTGTIALVQGNVKESLNWFELALQRDPLDPATLSMLCEAYLSKGRIAEARVAANRLLEVSGGTFAEHTYADVCLVDHQPDLALAEYEKHPDESVRLTGKALAHHAMGKKAESDVALAELENKFAVEAPFLIGCVHAYRRQIDQALAWLDRAYEERDIYTAWVKFQWQLNELRTDPRYKAFMRKMKLPE